jgi:polysaccharide deacetylase 2 family uncharacterized protein YibQ
MSNFARLVVLCFTSLFCLTISQTYAQDVAKPMRVAIVIDDIGYRQTDVNALSLPGNITYSVLPHTPYGQILALKAHQQAKEVLLHIPMEAENGKALGPGALTSWMNEQKIRESLSLSFAEVPFAVGINNHMGSLLTKMYRPMAWTMRFLKERNVLFLDSVTTKQSKARKIAKSFGVPALSRHIFLDNQLSDQYISGQFNQLIDQAKKYHKVIAIAHPHPETIKALNALIPKLAEQNIELVPISQLLSTAKTTQEKLLTTE